MHVAVTLLLLAAEPLTIDGAVARALTVAPELKARKRSEEAAGHRKDRVFSSYLPRLTAEASYLARAPKNELPIELPPIPGVEPIDEIDDIHHFQGGLKFGLRVFDLSRGALMDAAEARQRAETFETESVRSKLAFQVRATFLAALLARKVAKIAEESLVLAKREEKRAELKADVGTGTHVALAQARVRVASLRAQERRANSELDRHRARLTSLLDLQSLPPLAGDLMALAGPVEGLSLKEHPELRKLAASVEAAERAGAAADRKFIPTLSARGSIELVYPRALQLELGPVYQIGVTFSWSIFDGLESASAAEEQEANAAALAALSRATRDRLERELIDLEARARTARADLKSAKETMEQTEIYLRVAKAALEAGTGTELDVHNAELGLDRVRTAVERAAFALAMVRAETLMVYGKAIEQ